jgi:hypothetical protein
MTDRPVFLLAGRKLPLRGILPCYHACVRKTGGDASVYRCHDWNCLASWLLYGSTPMDVLSDVLRAVRLTGAVYFDIDASSPWVGESPDTRQIAASVMPGVEHVVSFHAVMSGSCWAALGDGSAPPLRLDAGDIVVFPSGAPNVMSSSLGARGEPNLAIYIRPIDNQLPFSLLHGGGGDERTRFVCGYFGCDARPFNPLLSALPPMVCTRNPPTAAAG